MERKLAMKWVKALRSGKYKQGSGRLRDLNNNYCCLGVLCEVAGKKAKINASDNSYKYESNSFFAPYDLLDNKYGNIPSLDVALVNLNDIGYDNAPPLTFDEIADIIQICYKEL